MPHPKNLKHCLKTDSTAQNLHFLMKTGSKSPKPLKSAGELTPSPKKEPSPSCHTRVVPEPILLKSTRLEEWWGWSKPQGLPQRRLLPLAMFVRPRCELMTLASTRANTGSRSAMKPHTCTDHKVLNGGPQNETRQGTHAQTLTRV